MKWSVRCNVAWALHMEGVSGVRQWHESDTNRCYI